MAGDELEASLKISAMAATRESREREEGSGEREEEDKLEGVWGILGR